MQGHNCNEMVWPFCLSGIFTLIFQDLIFFSCRRESTLQAPTKRAAVTIGSHAHMMEHGGSQTP